MMDTGTGGSPAGERSSEHIAGLAKGLRIIEIFGTEHGKLTIATAAKLAKLSRASARRCLLTLLDLGYVIQVGSEFRPTPRLLRLGAGYYESATLPQLAQSHLENARDTLHESISLAVLDEKESLFIARAEAEKIVSTVARIGRRLNAYCSATGRVLLADLPDDEVDAYLATVTPTALTSATLIDKKQIKRMVDLVRERGFSIVDEELEEGMVAMAVPVVDSQGHTVAAMSVSASRARISPERMEKEVLPVLLKHANALSRSL